jgi:D-alanyl-D-alanine carboxypeptidase
MALAFAEAVGGTAEGFQDVLARTAAAIGMQDPQTWHDPAGLDDEESVGGGNLVSARDLAIAGRAMIADPWLSPISAKPRYQFKAPDGVLHDALNHNKMVLGRYPGSIGGKTGYTKKAGNSLLASAQRNGRTMVAVVMDTKDEYGFTSGLFDKGFATPVAAEAGLEHLPPLRLPSAAAIKPAAPVAPAPVSKLEPPAAQAAPAADPTITIAPDQPSRAAEPLPVEPLVAQEGRSGLPLLAGGAAAAVIAAIGLGRGHSRRRRRRRYYQVPARRPAP